MSAEDLTLDDLKTAVPPMICRKLAQPAMLNLPIGIFSPVTLPLQDISSGDNPTVNLLDIISEYTEEIDFSTLERAFVEANNQCNMNLLPPPFGFKTPTAPVDHPVLIGYMPPNGCCHIFHISFREDFVLLITSFRA